MTVQTPWGYTVECLPPIIDVVDFRSLQPGLSSTDSEIRDMLDAVSSAVRNWCGWHISPALECDYIGQGDGRILMLPAMGVRSIESLEIDGVPIEDFEWTAAGMVRLKSFLFPDAWRSVKCSYKAGFDGGAIAQVVAQVAANAIVAAPGVANERAGNVSITYNQTGAGLTGGVSLLPRDNALLAPYRLVRAW